MKIMAIEIEHSAARADYTAAARADYAADIAHRIESIAIDLAAKHVADPLVGDNATPSDADDFDATTLRRALAESGLASSEEAVEALRAELRLALGR